MTSFTPSSPFAFRTAQLPFPQETSTQAAPNPAFFPPSLILSSFPPSPFFLTPPYNLASSLIMNAYRIRVEALALLGALASQPLPVPLTALQLYSNANSATALAFPPAPPPLPLALPSTSTTPSSSSTSVPPLVLGLKGLPRKRKIEHSSPNLLPIPEEPNEENPFFSLDAVKQLNQEWSKLQSQISKLLELRLKNLESVFPAHVIPFENPCRETLQHYSQIFRAMVIAVKKNLIERPYWNNTSPIYYAGLSAKALLLSQQNIVKFIIGQEGVQDKALVKYLLRNYKKKDLPSRIGESMGLVLRGCWKTVKESRTWNTKNHRRSERIRAQNNNLITDVPILDLILKENFETIPVVIKNLKITTSGIKKMTFNNFFIIDKNTIIYEKNSGKIVAVFKKSFYGVSIAKSIADELKTWEAENPWLCIADQKEINLGFCQSKQKKKLRFIHQKNSFFNHIHALHTQAFAKFLPQTFANALHTTRMFREADIVFNSRTQSPFTTLKVTQSTAQEKSPPHRGSHFYPLQSHPLFIARNLQQLLPLLFVFLNYFNIQNLRKKERKPKRLRVHSPFPFYYLQEMYLLQIQNTRMKKGKFLKVYINFP